MTSNNYSSGDTQSLGTVDWNSYRFSELNMDDLFWFEQNTKGDKNPPFRKVSDNEALDLRNQNVINVKTTLMVHQKEY